MKFYNFSQDPETGVTKITIDGDIVGDDQWWFEGSPDSLHCPSDFEVALADAGDVDVYVNSPGGDVIAASVIYSKLKEHAQNGHRVTCKVVGLAASAASVICMAASEILMAPTAYMMIHDPWTCVMGNPDELREAAKTLDVIADGIVEAYFLRAKDGISRNRIRELMKEETWLTARQAMKLGLCDGYLFGDKETETEEDDENADVGFGAVGASAKSFARICASIRARMPKADEIPFAEELPETEVSDSAAELARARLNLLMKLQGGNNR